MIKMQSAEYKPLPEVPQDTDETVFKKSVTEADDQELGDEEPVREKVNAVLDCHSAKGQTYSLLVQYGLHS